MFRRALLFKLKPYLLKRWVTPVMLLVVMLVAVLVADAGSEALDPEFGDGGVVTTYIRFPTVAHDIAVQSDGKILVVGYAGHWSATDNSADVAIVRYNADGSYDGSFGDEGVVLLDFNNGSQGATAVAVQTDGKFVVAGTHSYKGADAFRDFLLMRFNPDGSFDPTFGSGGIVTTDLGGLYGDWIEDMAIQPDGKIVVGGDSWQGEDYDFVVARYLGNGALDSSFGASGVVVTDVSGDHDSASGLALQPDGRIVLVGSPANRNIFAVARYTANGELDTTFGNGGLVMTMLNAHEVAAHDVALQPDGNIVVAGNGNFLPSPDTDQNVILARYLPDGSLDPWFGDTGLVGVDVGWHDFGYAVAVQHNRKIVLAGATTDPEAPGFSDIAVLRFHVDGSLDTGFAGDGLFTAHIDLPPCCASQQGNAIAFQPDSNFLVAGWGSDVGFALLRFLGEGTFDHAVHLPGVQR